MAFKIAPQQCSGDFYFRLREDDDELDLIATDADGNPLDNGCVLTICSEGLYLYDGLTEEAGLPTVSEGRVRVRLGE